MPKIDLVKAIVRYKSPFTHDKKFVYGKKNDGDSTRYLLLQKAEDANLENIGKWECVGGFIEKGETSIMTIERELKEETGLELKCFKKLPTIRNCDVYLIDASSNTVRLSDEHSDYRWVKARDVQKMELVAHADLLLEFFNNPDKYFS
jgi:8-oxo-dGTP pyrophosphatase MutT (NUDIX family)